MEDVEGHVPRSPDDVRLSLAAAMTLGYEPGVFFRGARLHCINLLLTYPEGCRARCAYCGLSARRSGAGNGKSFIRVQWPAYPLDDIIHRISSRQEAVRRICISMITRRRAVADTVTVCTRLRSSFDIPVSLLISPTLLGDGDLETREVSHTGEGRHTTTRRHLIVLAHGSWVVEAESVDAALAL